MKKQYSFNKEEENEYEQSLIPSPLSSSPHPPSPIEKDFREGNVANFGVTQVFLKSLKKLDWSWFHYSDARERIQSSFNRGIIRRYSDDIVAAGSEFLRLNKSASSLDDELTGKDKYGTGVTRADSEPVPTPKPRNRSLSLTPAATSILLKPPPSPPPPRPPRPINFPSIPLVPEIKVTTHTQTSCENLLQIPGGAPTPTPINHFFGNDDQQPCSTCYHQLQEFKIRFMECRSHKEKYEILTSVPVSLVQDEHLAKEFSCTDPFAYAAAALRASQGAFSSPLPQFIQNIPEFIRIGVGCFYDDFENGGDMKGKENLVEIGKRKKKQKRAMFISLSQLFQEYISVSTGTPRTLTISQFAYLTPSHVVWSKKFWGNSYNICLLHENIQLLLSACSAYCYDGALFERALANIVCSEKNCLCMLGYCDKCPTEKNIQSLAGDYSWVEVADFYLWQEYNEGGGNGNGNIGMPMTLMNEPVPQFMTRLDSTIRQFLKHHFISLSQKTYLNYMNSYLSRDKSFILVKMNFCEPYTVVSKIGSKKASKFFNYDPQKTICVYPFHVKYFDQDRGRVESRNIVVISNDLRDNATSAYFFQGELIKWVKHALPQVRQVIYFTDDNPKRHKCPQMILNLIFHEEDHNMKASLEYTVEGHDLEEVGWLATKIKRECRIASLKGTAAIENAEDMFRYCRKEMTRFDLQFCYVDRFISRVRNVEMRLKRRYKLNDGIIPGMQYFYSFQPENNRDSFKIDTIRVRRYSLSATYNVVKVATSYSSNVAAAAAGSTVDFNSPCLTSFTHPYNVSMLLPGNIVTVQLEGQLFTGKVNCDSFVELGNLGVTLKGKIDKGRGGRPLHVPLVEDRHVWISTLDVVDVEADEIEQARRKKDQHKLDEGKKGWAGRSLSPGRLFMRKKDKA